MKERRTIKIFDSMVKSNSILVGFSLVLLSFFIIYSQNIWLFRTWLNSTRFFSSYETVLRSYNFDMFIIILIPLLGAIFELLFGERLSSNRDKSIIYMGFVVIVYILSIYPKVLSGMIDFEIPGIFGVGIFFRIDMLAYTVLLVSSFVWFYVMIYAHEYMKKEKHGTRFFFFLALTYSAVLGTICSGDLLAMFLFFEIMTITSYMLVIHGQKEESYKAGYNYIIMGLIGGFLILTALILIYFNFGDLRFSSKIAELENFGNLKYWIMGLLVLGFGIKAGMAPVHVWLPRAHPVAPTPASALLSGVMIKIGAYGILRVAVSYYFPSRDTITSINDPLWLSVNNIGAIIIWTGIITMALGAFMALMQENIKKLLAYSSVSQMGYIVVSIGTALYLGYEGATGYTGAIYHIFNHALFKSLLFMVAGVIYFHTKELNMYKLGGIAKKLPFTTVVFFIAMLGIIGMPLFNGYVSKTFIHHGITEAAHINSSFYIAEVMYIVVSCMTVTYFMKMFYYVFIKKNESEYEDLVFDISSLDLALGSIALIIIGVGLNPGFVLNNLIAPQLLSATYDIGFVNSHILHMNIFNLEDIFLSLGIIIVGIIIFIVAKRYKLLNVKLPKWLSIEYLFFYPAYWLMRNICVLVYGSNCPYKKEELLKLTDRDTDKLGFIDRFVITTNVLNQRYEQSIIRSDALIYTFFITLLLIYLLVKSLLI
ncbi:MAG: proton-conducting membrane transporter [Tenericutes bacterium HGW-Tenericutes-6]|nr:MAG: proton-conducting membrane transporter [Tenericutes bacterium HGW-Tenericutes-6]